ncbi:hypothetical protein KZC51_06955 [Microbacterium sp. SSW1-49]|uniref:Agglutinin receptor n=1 Tax=Microbacterium croceum TaxID=2851645 RepID=A0ABT0FCS9_9MICO|nr:hypothetical protein [Microbacterium croceum]MCK2035872.1 hypothetical protein [Microbacterium croceum]
MKAPPLYERIAMSKPETAHTGKTNTSLLIRGAIWIAIGALIAAALVCVVWVLIGDQDGLIGRAFLTILLLAGFAGIAILEAGLAPNRPDWLALTSMVTWIVALLVGAVKIWLPEEGYYFGGAERFFQLLLVVGILQLALLHVRLFTPAAQRHVTTFTKIIFIVTVVFLGALVALLVFFLTFPQTFDYSELYWRIVVALTILAAVGTTLIPLLNALFAPKKPSVAAPAAAAPSWPTYADGITPLPALPDGSPDWNAYYTGYPTVVPQAPQAIASTPTTGFPVAQEPVAPASDGGHLGIPAPPIPPAPDSPAAPQPPQTAFPPAPPAPPLPPL